jgi:NADP-dependent 3-hydroxy acid dehydrogenase YdfG/acyl carrier protein
VPDDTGRLTGLMAEHLALHNEYLDHQLQTGQRMAGLLERAADQGTLGDVIAGVSAAKEHSLAMGRTHLKASEVLRDLARLEVGATVPARREPEETSGASATAAGLSAAPSVPANTESSRVEPASTDPASTDPAKAVAADEVAAALVGVVAEKTGYPAGMIDLDMALESDLGVDSIKRVEIVGALRERLSVGVGVGPEVFAEARSLRDIVDVLTPADPESVPASVPAPELGFEPAPGAGATSASEDRSSRAAIGRWHASLVQLPPPDRLLGGYPEPAVALVVDDGGPFAAAITTALSREGWRVRLLRLPAVAARRAGMIEYQLDSWAPTELGTKIAKVLAERVHLVIDCLTAGSGCWEHGTRRLAHSLLLAKHLVHPLTEAAASGRAALLTVTNLDGAFGLTGVAADLVPAAGVTGLVKTLAIEAPAVFCRAVDVAPGMTPEAAAAAVLAEAHDPAAAPLQVGLEGQRRVTLGLADQPAHLVESSPDGPAALSSDDLLVVTGGGRGITAACVVELSRRHQPGLLLLGRTQLEDDPAWASGVADAALKAAAAGFLRDSAEKPTPRRVDRLVRAVAGAREIRTTLELLRKAGSQAEYLAVDVKDPVAVAEALFGYRDRITGLVHGAGVLADQMIEKKQAAEIERVFGPKLAGLRSMIAALPAKALRHLVLFSSVAGFFGNRGQADYAMANEVLNAFAASWKADHPDCRVTSLNWGAWDSGMVTGELRTMFERRGIPLIPAGKGAELFAEQFTPDRAADLVTVLGPRVALSERPLPKLPGPVTVERSLDDYQSDPMIADHLIGGCPVLPAVVALGWIVGLVEQVTGSPVSGVRDFAIHKGIVFDGSQPRQCRLVFTPGPDAVKVTIHSVDRSGTVRPHYAAVVEPGPAPVPAAPTGLPPLGGGVEAGSRYRDGTLFHGPALRGLRRVLSEAETRLIVECQVPDPVAAPSAATASCFLPVAADLLLQACLVWVRDFRGTASLPLAIDQAEWWAMPSPGERFLVVVEPVIASNGSGNLLTVTACRPDGQVLTRMTGVHVIQAPALERKFG